MANWSGKSRGTLLGIRIYVLIIKKAGLYTAYFVLLFVALYFFIFSFTTSKSIYYLFRKRLRYSPARALLNIYKNYYTYGKIQLDRIAITSGFKQKFTFEFDGKTHIDNLLKNKKGGDSSYRPYWEL